MRTTLILAFLSCNLGCGIVQNATRVGMMPILRNGIDAFIQEPDLVVAEGAIAANMKLIEGVAATYPDEREPAVMAAMARANFAFGFVVDELEAVKLAFPDDTDRHEALLARATANFKVGQAFALRALMMNGDFADALGGKQIEGITVEQFESALAELEEDDADALFWLAFNWGGRMQAKLDPAQATQLPKVQKIVARVIELNERVFYGSGPNIMAGALHGFRSPALGGQPDKASKHFDRAGELGGNTLLPRVMKAQFVYAQTENPADFSQTLTEVVDAEPNPKMFALEMLAKRKACRLLANSDQFFLDDPSPLPAGCKAISHKHRLREPE